MFHQPLFHHPYSKHATVIVWFRRDLRLADNPALAAAVQSSINVIPVYIWAPEEEGQFQPGRCGRWWLHQSLLALSAELEALGSRLICLSADGCITALQHVIQATGATALFGNRLYDPITMVRDNELLSTLTAMGVRCHLFNADLLYEPWEVMGDDGKPLDTFAAFWQRVCMMPNPPLPPLPPPVVLPAVPPDLDSEDVDDLGLMTREEMLTSQQLQFMWTPGSKGAHRMLTKFLTNRLPRFAHDRAKTDRSSTSKLSPHLHFGEMSVRYVYYAVKQREAAWSAQQGGPMGSCVDFLQQIGYREYSRYLSWHFPFTHERSLLEHVRACPYRIDQGLFKAWRQGRTGYPLVDAAMRELWSTGWMHNRMRVVAASFLVKNLLLPWQWGLKHYWDALADADLECDALGWQYCAGCLADAHPLDYMFDHAQESKRFDPDGQYVRQWLPVLSRLPPQYIHTPWEAPPELLDEACVELGVNYPFPVVEPAESRRLLDCAVQMVNAALKITSGVAARGPYRPPTLNPADPQAPPELRELYAKFQAEVSSDALTAVSVQRRRVAATHSAQTAAPEEVVSNFVTSERAVTYVSSANGSGSEPVSALPHTQQHVALDTSAPSTSGTPAVEVPQTMGGPGSAMQPTDPMASTWQPPLLDVGRRSLAVGSAAAVRTSGSGSGSAAKAMAGVTGTPGWGSHGTETSLNGPPLPHPAPVQGDAEMPAHKRGRTDS